MVGDLMRLDDRTPARRAFNEYLKVVRRPQGRPKLTWGRLVYNDIKQFSNLNVNFDNEFSCFRDLTDICADRQRWRKIVGHNVAVCNVNMF